MSSAGPVAPVGVAPVAPTAGAPTAAALRAAILGAAETELIAMLSAVPDLEATAPPSSTTTSAAPANPTVQAVDTARTAAAVQQASLAPLFADLAETLSSPNLPAPIRAAIVQVLALQLPADGPIAPADIRQAITQSGLFLEAALAAPNAPAPLDLKAALLTLRQVLPAPAPPPAQAETPPTAQEAAPRTQPSSPVTSPESQLQSAVVPAVQLQTAPSQPAWANPAAQSAEPAPTLATTPSWPGAVVAAPGQVLPSQAPAAGPAAAAIPPETPAPSAPPPTGLEPALPQTPVSLDPKGALLTLQQALPEPPVRDRPDERPPQDLKGALLSFQQAAREPAAAAPSPQAQRPAPPVRDAALSPQAPAPATLPEHADLSALAEHLGPQVEQALARLTLHQLASLPDGASSAWMFELPIATPQGTAMAQFEIERDGAGSGGGDAAAPWRARFSIDIEPLGPVHVHVAMSGGKAAVSVWAERTDSLDWLRGQGEALAHALPAEVVFRAGAPGGATPARGHFLDQTS